mgnify:CR=1 FL=1
MLTPLIVRSMLVEVCVFMFAMVGTRYFFLHCITTFPLDFVTLYILGVDVWVKKHHLFVV